MSGASEMFSTRVGSVLTRNIRQGWKGATTLSITTFSIMTLNIQNFVLISVPNKPFQLSVIMPTVVKLNVMAPLERLARDKHSSLLQIFVGYGCKKFITLTPNANVIKLFTDVIYKFS